MRGLDPFTTNLVVADPERSRTTICLAITPALKELGVRNRCRVFEIPEGIDYIMATPRMHLYMEVSSQIYAIYLRYVSADDVHVYSIDECFIDITSYLALYGKTPRQMARMLMDAVFAETGICATAGIGINLFLAKVALDITAKHADDGIGVLDEAEFKRVIWPHRPLTDIWNIGPGIARRLAKYGVHDLYGVTRMREKTLYREFGVNAEFLIDHAWGQEPCTIAEIHAYEPKGHSLVNGQVLPSDYTAAEARMVMREMVDASTLDLVRQEMAADRIDLHVGYARREGRPKRVGGRRRARALVRRRAREALRRRALRRRRRPHQPQAPPPHQLVQAAHRSVRGAVRRGGGPKPRRPPHQHRVLRPDARGSFHPQPVRRPRRRDGRAQSPGRRARRQGEVRQERPAEGDELQGQGDRPRGATSRSEATVHEIPPNSGPASAGAAGEERAHRARPHADRARQFMPFAALKGYYELVRQQERVEQPRHQLTDEEALELSARLAALRKGDMVRVTYYDQDAYTSIRGAVTRIDEPFRTLRVVMTDIPFDDILRIEDGGTT